MCERCPETVIGYHGTTAVAAKVIERTGFKPGTYFAARPEDALRFGGPHIFVVVFEGRKFKHGDPGDEWQWHLNEHISPDNIVCCMQIGLVGAKDGDTDG